MATTVVDGNLEVKLSDYRGKYVILFFCPLDFITEDFAS
jgi:alkyl hydroperoxide reductase subunit AhpC